MPSKQSEAVKSLYRSWTEARLHPELVQPDDNEHWGDLTAERADLITSKPTRAVCRRCGRYRKDAPRTA